VGATAEALVLFCMLTERYVMDKLVLELLNFCKTYGIIILCEYSIRGITKLFIARAYNNGGF